MASTTEATLPAPAAPAVIAPARARSIPQLGGRLLTLAAGLCAALPVIASTIRAAADGWMPAGDQAIIATRAFDVFTSHTPLVGQYSVASGVTGQVTYSPGPMLYWLLALPARFAGPTALAVTMGIANVLAVLAIVALARRRGGRLLMFAVAAGLAVMCRSFAPETLHDIWNPSAGVFPFTLLIFLCWSLACGEYRLLPATVVVASYAAQCHLAFVPPGLGLLAVGLGGLALTRRRSPAEERRPLWPWALAALAAGAICWSAPIVDQIVHRPGNFVLLERAARAQKTTLGARGGSHALVRAVGVPPRWLRTPSDRFDTRLTDITTAPNTAADISCLLVLAALIAAAVAGMRRRRTDVAFAALIGLVLCGALAAVAAATPTKASDTLGYTLWWGSSVGMWVWLILAWTIVTLLGLEERVRAGRRLAVASVLGAVAAGGAGAAVAAAEQSDAHSNEYGPLRAIFARLDATVPRGKTVWTRGSSGITAIPFEPAIKFALRRRGIRVLGHGSSARLGSWYELDHRHYDYVIYDYAGGTPRFRLPGVIAQVGLTDRRGRHTLTVTMSKPRQRRKS